MTQSLDEMTPDQIRRAYENDATLNPSAAIEVAPGCWQISSDPEDILKADRVLFVRNLEELEITLDKLHPVDSDYPELRSVRMVHGHFRYSSDGRPSGPYVEVLPPESAQWGTSDQSINWERLFKAVKKHGSIRLSYTYAPVPAKYELDPGAAGEYVLLTNGCYKRGSTIHYDPKKVRTLMSQRRSSRKRRDKQREKEERKEREEKRVCSQYVTFINVVNDWIYRYLSRSLAYPGYRLTRPRNSSVAVSGLFLESLLDSCEDIAQLEEWAGVTLKHSEEWNQWLRTWIPEYEQFCEKTCPPKKQKKRREEHEKQHRFWTWWHRRISSDYPGALLDVAEKHRGGPPGLRRARKTQK